MAIGGVWPPAQLLLILTRLLSTKLLNGVVQQGEDTVICITSVMIKKVNYGRKESVLSYLVFSVCVLPTCTERVSGICVLCLVSSCSLTVS